MLDVGDDWDVMDGDDGVRVRSARSHVVEAIGIVITLVATSSN